jgi:hypothetical protein
VKRQTLDVMGPGKGARVRVFFPGRGGGARVMTATGEVRRSAGDRCEHDHLLENEGGAAEWVPGWYVAQPAGSRRIYSA